MNVTETIETTDVAPWDPDEPLVAHHAKSWWQPGGDPYTALCGARLIGIKAPPNHEPKCSTCERLAEEYLFGGFGRKNDEGRD